MHKLKKGYTTGVHASLAFRSALEVFLVTKKLSISKTVKMDNDDIDVTKGCKIVVSIASSLLELTINKIRHTPYTIEHKNSIVKIYAGNGVGIVSKDGLKPPSGYPAINPKPLEVMSDIFKKNIKKNMKLFCTISVVNGYGIAKKTANKKVGVLGGISILGTTGFVKPISTLAYVDSIKSELEFAYCNDFKILILTLGNTAYSYANSTKIKNQYIIEIGNFIHEALSLAIKKGFNEIRLYLSSAKAVKVVQGFKNTHNRFGQIEFKTLQKWFDIDISSCTSVKMLKERLGKNSDNFDRMLEYKTKIKLKKWFDKDIKVKIC